MTTPIEQVYFQWLCDHVKVGNGKSYSGLFEQLHNKEFVWIVPNDDNRIHDAVDLRNLFLDETGMNGTCDLKIGVPPISVLEVVLGICERLSFQIDGDPGVWAWTLLGNLDLHKFEDPVSPRMADLIDDKLDEFIWRTYSPSGEGGLFPLKNPPENQTKVELWYQMHAWIDENFEI